MEKDNTLAKCRLGLRALRTKKPMLCLHAVTDEDGHPLENEDESGRIGARSLRRVSKANGTIARRLSCGTFKRRLAKFDVATKKGICSRPRWNWLFLITILHREIAGRSAFVEMKNIHLRDGPRLDK